MDKTKPIVFLDIDGVLNSANYYKNLGEKNNERTSREDDLDPEAIKHLNEISDWNFVLSSSWRTYNSIENINKMLKNKGFEGEIIDYTSAFPRQYSLRGNEIYSWICKNVGHGNTFKKYVIFDDDSDMLYWQRNNFIHVDGYFGLSPNHVYRAKMLFKK